MTPKHLHSMIEERRARCCWLLQYALHVNSWMVQAHMFIGVNLPQQPSLLPEKWRSTYSSTFWTALLLHSTCLQPPLFSMQCIILTMVTVLYQTLLYDTILYYTRVHCMSTLIESTWLKHHNGSYWKPSIWPKYNTIIFHQPGLSWNKGFPLLNYLLGYKLPRSMAMVWHRNAVPPPSVVGREFRNILFPTRSIDRHRLVGVFPPPKKTSESSCHFIVRTWQSYGTFLGIFIWWSDLGIAWMPYPFLGISDDIFWGEEKKHQLRIKSYTHITHIEIYTLEN